MATSSKREGLCHRLRDLCSCTQSFCPCSRPLLNRGSGSVPVGSLGPGAHKVLFEPCECLRRVWALILNVISPLSCWGFSFPLGHGVSFFGGIQHSPVDGCSAACCILGVLTEDEHRSFYSILFVRTKHQRRIIEVDQPCLSDCGPLLHTYTVWQLKETSSCRLKGFRFSLPE